ncbi:MAG: NADH-quinone oxidoreductase subunit J [Propionibacteriaceae bacterium]|nr:NADH-quinone oxidoreductase subunit J [Propionibacteriaceae bacterium]
MIPLTIETDIVFWICGPLMVAGAFGLVLFRKAVYSALSMAFVMVNLAALYAAMGAPLLAAAQIIVYTGAIMMLFLFVLMLVGVDRADSLVETIKGQRVWTALAAIGVAGLIIAGIGHVAAASAGLDSANEAYGGNVQGLAAMLFNRYVFPFELTSALLITAAVGAMVLAQHARLTPKKTQAERAAERMEAYATAGVHPGALPNSGVIARHNSIATPALLPDGSISGESVSEVLLGRGAIVDTPALSALTAANFAGVAAELEGEEPPVPPALDTGPKPASLEGATPADTAELAPESGASDAAVEDEEESK